MAKRKKPTKKKKGLKVKNKRGKEINVNVRKQPTDLISSLLRKGVTQKAIITTLRLKNRYQFTKYLKSLEVNPTWAEYRAGGKDIIKARKLFNKLRLIARNNKIPLTHKITIYKGEMYKVPYSVKRKIRTGKKVKLVVVHMNIEYVRTNGDKFTRFMVQVFAPSDGKDKIAERTSKFLREYSSASYIAYIKVLSLSIENKLYETTTQNKKAK